jgi:Domain of unknown function (DUF4145)
MKCMHCLVEFHDQETRTRIGEDEDGGWALGRHNCPKCKRMNLFLLHASYKYHYQQGMLEFKLINAIPIRPKGTTRSPCPPEVPPSIAEDYTEACLVLADSPKASAALSRRCLQNVLRDAAKVKPSNLADEIQQVLDRGHLPSHLAEIVDAVRQTGNFAAHPVKSQVSGQILPVEPHEAEWNLDVLEALFDFYYVQPMIIAKKRAALNAKLQEAGKKPMK